MVLNFVMCISSLICVAVCSAYALSEQKSYTHILCIDINTIEDLNLHGVQYLAIGKLLSGPATDMTIMCCIHEQCNHTEEEVHSKHCVWGLALATCCHHLCQLTHYASNSA
ncbi:hypothetical protein BRADI_3g07815v3 [Brachypodium distachyon]|uniref:tRNA:m(4)X modification enzyme TRM13 n=1 Tax=Brachypodium distachyon TaxID=15368 RepID=A0A2K2CVU9_BRADI|nr:hypothetical protein BRADI_3g07815v3 [Brachypodium distachyon]